ncbi:MAG: CPBP family intramembrane glutamic endopeptidase [Acidobacteriota bacterium]|nr:CPBP family intramembrane glutamic endopeptidase [Acidobacteriota bacterium]
MSRSRERDRAPAAPAWRLYAAVAGSCLLFAAALATRDRVSVWLSTGMAAALAMTLCFWVDGPALRRLFRTRPGNVLQGLAGGVVMALLTHLLYPVTVALLPNLAQQVRGLYADLAAPPGLVAALPVLVVVVVAEECIWRGVLMDAVLGNAAGGRRMVAAVVLSSLIYTLPQLGSGSPVLFALALVCGLVWAAQRLWSRSLVTPTLTHLTWNLLVFVAFPLERVNPPV